jgi:hypothetical protein
MLIPLHASMLHPLCLIIHCRAFIVALPAGFLSERATRPHPHRAARHVYGGEPLRPRMAKGLLIRGLLYLRPIGVSLRVCVASKGAGIEPVCSSEGFAETVALKVVFIVPPEVRLLAGPILGIAIVAVELPDKLERNRCRSVEAITIRDHRIEGGIDARVAIALIHGHDIRIGRSRAADVRTLTDVVVIDLRRNVALQPIIVIVNPGREVVADIPLTGIAISIITCAPKLRDLRSMARVTIRQRRNHHSGGDDEGYQICTLHDLLLLDHRVNTPVSLGVL